MKDKYKSINCPICDKSLENSDVVVCPDCGAPYHRSCYAKEQQCIFPELHASGKSYKPPNIEPEISNQNPNQVPHSNLENTSNSCTRCGTVNPSTGVFCQICGNKLAQNPINSPYQPPQNINNPNNLGERNDFPTDKFEPSKNYTPPNGIPLNHIVNPLGGLAPNETIDDVPVKDIAVFVGSSSHYYLPKFKDISQNKGNSINFAAFFFMGGFFLYRKMFLIGALFCAFDILFSIPSSLLLYERMSTQMLSGAQLAYQNPYIQDLEMICSMFILILRCVCGFLANNIYKKHVISKIKELKSKNQSESEYFKSLSKNGSVATGLIRFILFAYLTSYFIFLLTLLS